MATLTSSNPATVHWVDSVSDLPADALSLLAGDTGRSMQLGPAWFENYGRQLGNNFGQPAFGYLQRHGLTLAVLPVAWRRQAGGGCQVTSLSNYFTSLYAPAVQAQGEDATEPLAILIHATLRHLAPVAKLQFWPMDPSSLEYKTLLRALRRCGLFTTQYYCFGNWYLQTEGRDWNTYLATRPGELRNTLKRMKRKFLQAGGTLELITGGERLGPGLAAYEACYAASWKRPEEHPQFVTGLISACASQGWLRLGVAWIDGHPVAAQVWIVANDRAEIYKLAYNEDFKLYSPGTLLTAMLMEQALNVDRVVEVDYLTGDDAYKAAWMETRRERWGLVAHNIRSAVGVAGAARELAGWLWRRWRRRPAHPA